MVLLMQQSLSNINLALFFVMSLDDSPSKRMACKLSICHKQIFPETKRDFEILLFIKFNEHLYNFNNGIRVNTSLLEY